MAAEDTELTFIRCPSCRSLIPAVASRCRMCGFVLKDADGAVEAAAPEPTPPTPEPAPQAPVAPPAPEPTPQAAPTPPPPTGNQPTGGFSLGAPLGSKQPTPQEDSAPRLNRHDSIVHGVPETVEPEASKTQEISDVDKILENTSASSEGHSHSHGHGHGHDDEGRGKKKRKRKRKKRPTGSMSLADGNSNEGVEVEITSSPEGTGSDLEAQPRRHEESRQGKEDRRQDHNAQQVRPQNIQNRHSDRQDRDRGQQNNNRSRSNGHSREVVPGTDTPLVAWFVNYEDPKGKAIEIREGRFFISGERVKETDLVLNSDTISSPHCIIKAEPGSGIMVQDLMSENGTEMLKSGGVKYKSIESATAISHGDRLKFGDYEVLVCIIPIAEDKEKKIKK